MRSMRGWPAKRWPARARAHDLARALGTSLRAPLALASRGVVAPRCLERADYAPAAPRGIVVGGPQFPAAVATYASISATYALAAAPAIAPRPRGASGPGVAPEAYFRATSQRPSADVEVARARAPLTVRGIATRYVPAERAEVDVAIASDRAHRFAAVDPVRAYALAAPLERIAGRAPTRVVLAPARSRPLGRGVSLHLDLRAPLERKERARLQALLEGARRLGATNVRVLFESSHTGRGEAAARRAALADAYAAARREAAVRRVRLDRLVAIVEAEPFIDRTPVRGSQRRLDQRIALVVCIDATYVTKLRAR